MNMACQKCKKNPATVHLLDIVKGEKRERHLCNQCAYEEGVALKPHAPISKIISEFMSHKGGAQEMMDLTCPECGMTFAEFRSHGLLGCPDDYEAFAEPLLPLIANAHEGAEQHIGKIPSRADAAARHQGDLLRLKHALDHAVEQEDYEAAAKLRDQIKELED